ncbi:MAG: hypothetical protein K6L80_05555 [Agarilytica sp.]
MLKLMKHMRLVGLVLSLGFCMAGHSIASGASYKGYDYEIDYSLRSLSGEYVMVAEGKGGTGPEVVFGVVYFDGAGNISGSLRVNTGLDGQPRTVSEVNVDGQYSIEGIGEGVFGFSSALTSAIYVVRESKVRRGKKRVTELAFVADGLTETGNVLRGFIKKRTRKHDFTDASVAGDFGLINEGFGGLGQGIAVGVVTWEPDTNYIFGNFTGSFPGQNPGERSVIEFFSGGPFSINPDGTGVTLSDTTGGQSHYLVTETEWYRGKQIAKEIYFAVEFLDPFGNWSPATMTRISK